MITGYRATHLIYCLELLECGRYVALNRNYKPIGFLTDDRVNYGEYPVLLDVRVTPRAAARISWKGDSNTARIYLYNDGCIPVPGKESWSHYCERLGVLAKVLDKAGALQGGLIHPMTASHIRGLNLKDGGL